MHTDITLETATFLLSKADIKPLDFVVTKIIGETF